MIKIKEFKALLAVVIGQSLVYALWWNSTLYNSFYVAFIGGGIVFYAMNAILNQETK